MSRKDHRGRSKVSMVAWRKVNSIIANTDFDTLPYTMCLGTLRYKRNVHNLEVEIVICNILLLLYWIIFCLRLKLESESELVAQNSTITCITYPACFSSVISTHEKFCDNARHGIELDKVLSLNSFGLLTSSYTLHQTILCERDQYLLAKPLRSKKRFKLHHHPFVSLSTFLKCYVKWIMWSIYNFSWMLRFFKADR